MRKKNIAEQRRDLDRNLKTAVLTLSPYMTGSKLEEFATDQKQQGKKKLVGPLFLAIAIQVVLLLLTVFVVVLVPSGKEDPQFSAKKSIYLPQRKLEHKMAVAEFQQAAKSPLQMEKIQVAKMMPTHLPELPEMPQMEFTPVIPDTPSPMGNALFGNSGIGGMMQGLAGEASSISFLGINDNASRVLIVFDISGSVVNAMESSGIPMSEIKKETIQLIEELNANTLFGMIQHSRQYQLFESALIPATQSNKEKAIRWIEDEFTTSGYLSGSKYNGEDGVAAVMEAAFDMQPEVIFLLSDGSYQRTPGGRGSHENVPWSELEDRIEDRQDQLAEEARIHTIGFAVDEEDRKGFSRIATKNNGKYRSFD